MKSFSNSKNEVKKQVLKVDIIVTYQGLMNNNGPLSYARTWISHWIRYDFCLNNNRFRLSIRDNRLENRVNLNKIDNNSLSNSLRSLNHPSISKFLLAKSPAIIIITP